MSILDLTGVNVNDTFEPTTLPKGEEAKLRIVNVIEGKDKNGNAYIMPFFESTEDPYCKEFGDYIPLPTNEMDAKTLNKTKLKIQNFASAFSIDLSRPLDVEADLKGKEGWAIVGLGKDKEDQPTNNISKYMAGK